MKSKIKRLSTAIMFGSLASAALASAPAEALNLVPDPTCLGFFCPSGLPPLPRTVAIPRGWCLELKPFGERGVLLCG